MQSEAGSFGVVAGSGFELEPISLLTAIAESSDDAIISKDLNGIIRTWNPGAERLFGYSAEEAIGQPIQLLIPEERHHEEDMIFARIRRGEKVDHFETERRRKDGSLVNVCLTISPIRSADGSIVGAAKVSRDIGQRIAAEALQARMAAIVESSDDAIVSKNLNGTIQSWNRGAERIFGYLAEEMIGETILKLMPPGREEEEAKIIERLRRGERVDHFETVRRRKDGTLIDVSVTISPIRNAQGEVVAASKVARDITERKVIEATIKMLNEELEQRVSERTAALEVAHKEMEAFTYSVAHDLREPLREISLSGALLFEDFGDELPSEAQGLVRQQIDSAKRLSRLIEDLLHYARLGQVEVTCSNVDITAMARDVWQELARSRTDCQMEIQEGMFAWGDRILLRLVVQNLIDNACKFSPQGGTVRMGTKERTFFLEDQGIGFDMAFADKIFKPFQRLVKSNEVPGTGIGLANVQRILQKHGGKIWVQSAPGQGTTFFFTLPESPASR